MVLWHILAWFPMTVIAIANGVLRVGTYGKRMSELRAHQVSTLTGVLFIGLFIALLGYFLPLRAASEAWTVGAAWLVMTVAFEFLFGHYVAKHSWERLLQDYNLLKGRIWPLILVWIAVAPYLFFRLFRGA
jgi:hypothetical protein